ncbi:hypothetical protein BABINDRAFT_176111 [Babjeviella inositovora NRRL Y-12698]|uniref:Uncharacterized protein n=1 Tax=Babjeviella inositovora NRRL Y-12698 TaxID=984486 RepID=A0A1E3QR41_9ASCO|nr:uncharacterized protein BABINDRAFT_176111 [Babjeviella inositovora NRRL Y-12698]ODQ79954.1 hypothetical protein BABINDRAFT_176111 [Babjeviella inositovora NRRL Y-12698]
MPEKKHTRKFSSFQPGSIPVPDLRYEHGVTNSISDYAKSVQLKNHTQALGLKEAGEAEDVEDLPPPPITPTIVLWVIWKNQIMMPLLQSFLWTGFLLSLGPVRNLIIGNGVRCGLWLRSILAPAFN